MENQINLSLFKPGMTNVHKIGLAGLFMTLNELQKSSGSDFLSECKFNATEIILKWKDDPFDFFDNLFKKSFLLKNDGLIEFAGHGGALGVIKSAILTESLLLSFLQHGQTRKILPETLISIPFEDSTIDLSINKPLSSYCHQNAVSELFNSKRKFKDNIELKGWLFPGGVVRHNAYPKDTKLGATPDEFICLLYAPVAVLFFTIFKYNNIGKREKKYRSSIVIPHIINLYNYANAYKRYLDLNVQQLTASGLGDAGLMSLLTLKSAESMENTGISGCTVSTLGILPWSKQQKSRSGSLSIETIDIDFLNTFDAIWKNLPNRMVKKERQEKKSNKTQNRVYYFPSSVRGLFAQNLAEGKPWFTDFYNLVKTKEIAEKISFERRNLNMMVNDDELWTDENEQLFVKAVHNAIRNIYGRYAAEATRKNEILRWEREFEKIRTSFNRAKNQETLRAEVANLFTKGQANSVLKSNWQKMLPLFTGNDWQKIRDLVLFGLVSYSGKGAEKIEEDIDESIKEMED